LKKRAICAVICTALALSSYSTVLGDPLSDQLNNQKKQLQQDQGALKNVQTQTNNLESKVEQLDNQIQNLMNQISDTKKQITKTQSDIQTTQKDIDKSENDIQGEQDLFDQRMRAMYINGVDSYAEVILQSKGLSDLISRVETIKKLIDFDKNLLADLEGKKQVIVNKKQALDAQNTKLMSLKADSEQKLAQVNDNKTSQSKLLDDLKKQQKLYASKVDASKQQVNQTLAQIAAIRKAAPSVTTSRGSAPLSSNAIVAYASNFLGTPYQWGGNGTSTFDCSGFTKYVYAHFGVSLPRVASDQQQFGTDVSRSQLQAGDLVFFGYPAHHVGIYVGNGCFIHAPHTGDSVKVSSLDGTDFSSAKRVN
jgi:peptidoglycan DL-endopeptidase CwlO